MTGGILSVVLFLQDYLVPGMFAIGAIFFLFGIVNSFMLDRPDLGQPNIVRAVFFFGIAIFLYLALAFLGMLMTRGWDETNEEYFGDAEFGAEVNQQRSILPTPNVPSRND
ncbi:MAG: hypothetical protein WDZ93_01430 [Candidatus Paceibacterota bacterium]